MITTRQNVSWIQDRNPNYSPEQILSILDEIHYRIKSANIDYNYYIDESTGMPPKLVTTDGVYSYTCPDNCRKTSGVFVPVETYNRATVGPHYSSNSVSGIQNTRIINWGGRDYCSINSVRQKDKTGNSNAKVIFTSEFNPGTTTDKYFHLYWEVPNRIETVEDEMDIPEEFSFEIRQAISAMLSTEDYGETGYDTVAFENACKKVVNGLTAGARRATTNTTWLREYR